MYILLIPTPHFPVPNLPWVTSQHIYLPLNIMHHVLPPISLHTESNYGHPDMPKSGVTPCKCATYQKLHSQREMDLPPSKAINCQ